MNPPPTIPTSFVPKQPVQGATRFTRSGGNTFLMVALFVLGLAILGSAGVFIYERWLISQRDSKAEKLAEAQASINADTVEQFIRSRDRFSAARTILDNHVAASEFFSLLEGITLQNVRFDSLVLDRLADGSAEIEMGGTARSFNALAAQSSLFTNEKYVKRAIFSQIQVEPSGVVTFALSAELDPRLLTLLVENAPNAVPPPAAATTTAPAATTTAPQAPVSPATPVAPGTTQL